VPNFLEMWFISMQKMSHTSFKIIVKVFLTPNVVRTKTC